MNEYLLVKWLHIVSSTLLFGTGLGSAFYLFFAMRTRNAVLVAGVSRLVVRADWWFTTPSIIIQPLSGLYLVHLAGFPYHSAWLLWSIGLYLLARACWLPVVWLQIRMHKMAEHAVRQEQALPPLFQRYACLWTILGVPAFIHCPRDRVLVDGQQTAVMRGQEKPPHRRGFCQTPALRLASMKISRSPSITDFRLPTSTLVRRSLMRD